LPRESRSRLQNAVLGAAPRVGVEAAVRFGWDRWLGPRSAFIGMSDFGASAPPRHSTRISAFTPEKVVEGSPLAFYSIVTVQEDKTMAIRVAINGFGRIGRLVMRARSSTRNSDIEVVGINDLARSRPTPTPSSTTACMAAFPASDDRRQLNGCRAGRSASPPSATRPKLPWRELGVDIALECTGIFTKPRSPLRKHLEAGAKKVIISARPTAPNMTIVRASNHEELTAEHKVISNASCTTNCPGAGRLCACIRASASNVAT